MAKSSYDLAALLDVLIRKLDSESFTTNLTYSWPEISVAFLDPDALKNSEDESSLLVTQKLRWNLPCPKIFKLELK